MVKKTTSAPPAIKKKESILKALSKKYEGVNINAFNGRVDVIPTGSLSLDIALGVGGIARGRIFEIYGPESVGKTFIFLNIAKNAQAMGYKIAYIDTEFALDPAWMTKLGVKVAPAGSMDFSLGMVVITTDNLETAGEIAVDLADSGEVDVIFFDSVAGAAYKAVQEGDLGDANMGVRARIMSQFMPKLNGPVKKNNIFMAFSNQIRSSMDMYKPIAVPGGKALPFHASQRVGIISGRKEKVAQGERPKYIDVSLEVVKNKIAPPFRRAKYKLYFTDGTVDTFEEVADILTDSDNFEALGIVASGAWYTLPPEIVAPGYEAKINGAKKIMEMLASDLDHFAEVVKFIRSKLIANGDIGSREHTNTINDEPDEVYAEDED